MKFWDSSALVPLLVEEESTASLSDLYRKEDGILVWWGTEVECVSAITRSEREARLSASTASLALRRLETLALTWHRIEPTGAVRRTAKRFLRVHNLRAADSLQLASAFLAAEGQPPTLGFVCLDDRLVVAAQKEGFQLVDLTTLDRSSP